MQNGINGNTKLILYFFIAAPIAHVAQPMLYYRGGRQAGNMNNLGSSKEIQP